MHDLNYERQQKEKRSLHERMTEFFTIACLVLVLFIASMICSAFFLI